MKKIILAGLLTICMVLGLSASAAQADPVAAAQIDSARVTIAADLTLDIEATVTDASADPAARFTINGSSVQVPGTPGGSAGRWTFSFPGIGAQCMADDIRIEILDGGTAIADETTSIRAYFDTLHGMDAQTLGLTDEGFAALKTLLADALTYGAAAQLYVGHNTGNPADSAAWVSAEKSVYEGAPAGDVQEPVVSSGSDRIEGVSLVLFNDVRFRFRVQTAGADSLVIAGGGAPDAVLDLTGQSGSTRVVTGPGIYATDFDTPYTISLMKGQTVRHRVTYSVNSYIRATQGSDDAALAQLVRALSLYGRSADRYADEVEAAREQARAEIRRAISLLIDRSYLVENVTGGGQAPASSFVPLGMQNPDGTEFCATAGGNVYPGYYDVSEAAADSNLSEACGILKKYYDFDETAGRFTNFPALTYIYNQSGAHAAIAQYLSDRLASVGITLNLSGSSWPDYLDLLDGGNFSLARNGWIADYADPISFLEMWVSGSGNNSAGLGSGAHASVAAYSLDLTPYGIDVTVENGTWSQTYDVLISAIKRTTDENVRYAMMHLAENMLMDTGCVMPLYYYTDLYMLDDSVDGFFSSPLGGRFFMHSTVGGSGDGISVCLASEPQTMDPALSSTTDEASMLSHLFSGLARWEKDDSGRLVPVADAANELVSGVENPDGTVTYTYTLKNATWSDGQPVTAQDFVYAWKRAASEQFSDYGYLFEVIKGYDTGELAVEAPDAGTLRVTLNVPCPYWEQLLAFPTFFPVREDVAANADWASSAATYVSNGMYTLSAWEHDSKITLVKNPSHPDAASVTMNRIEFVLSEDAAGMVDAYRNGQLMLIDDIPAGSAPALAAEFPGELVTAGSLGTYYANWNVNFEILPE